MLRGEAAKRATGRGGYCPMTSDQVWEHWGVVKTPTELRVRRVRWYQRMHENPKKHGQTLAAIFGTSRIDQSKNKTRFDASGCLTPASTPWARQWQEDMEQLAQTEQGIGWWERAKQNLIVSFTDIDLKTNSC